MTQKHAWHGFRGAIGLSPSAWLGLVAFVGVGWLLIRVPLAASKEAR